MVLLVGCLALLSCSWSSNTPITRNLDITLAVRVHSTGSNQSVYDLLLLSPFSSVHVTDFYTMFDDVELCDSTRRTTKDECVRFDWILFSFSLEQRLVSPLSFAFLVCACVSLPFEKNKTVRDFNSLRFSSSQGRRLLCFPQANSMDQHQSLRMEGRPADRSTWASGIFGWMIAAFPISLSLPRCRSEQITITCICRSLCIKFNHWWCRRRIGLEPPSLSNVERFFVFLVWPRALLSLNAPCRYLSRHRIIFPGLVHRQRMQRSCSGWSLTTSFRWLVECFQHLKGIIADDSERIREKQGRCSFSIRRDSVHRCHASGHMESNLTATEVVHRTDSFLARWGRQTGTRNFR